MQLDKRANSKTFSPDTTIFKHPCCERPLEQTLHIHVPQAAEWWRTFWEETYPGMTDCETIAKDGDIETVKNQPPHSHKKQNKTKHTYERLLCKLWIEVSKDKKVGNFSAKMEHM